METRHWILGITLLALLGAAVAGFVSTAGADPGANFRHPVIRRPPKPVKKAKGPKGAKEAKAAAKPQAQAPAPAEPVVDEGPLRTARALAATAEEVELARQAEEEWKRTTTRYRVQAFSAQPGINVRPTSNGIEVRVRYITRAYQRHEVQQGLYQSVVEIMHGTRPEEGAPTGA